MDHSKRLDPEYCKVIAALIREYGRALCEALAAKAMLKTSAEKRIPIPALWEDALEAAKGKPELATLAQDFEMFGLRLEQDALETDLIELLKQMPVKPSIN